MNPSTSAAPHIQISLFGTLQVVRGKHIVTEGDWHTRQARQLLKILITERPRPVSTDRLIEILWPDSTPHAAATTLRSAINSLRNVLEPARPNRAPSHYIVTQMPGYAFQPQPDVWLDVEDFEQKLSLAQQTQDAHQRRRLLEDALLLYRDDYLISDPYADWAASERERLRERYFAALLQLAEFYAQAGNYTEAISTCRRILARDEVRENAYQALMRYQTESGDSAAALLTYERCRTILLDELGADPSPLTQTLHQRILNGEIEPRSVKILAEPTTPSEEWRARAEVAHPTPIFSTPLKPPAPAITLDQVTLMPVLDTARLDLFVGRETEMKLIEHVLHEALKGKGGLIVLEGEAGVGKSRLAYHVLQEASAAQATVISTACQALEKQLPFAPLADSVGRYLHNLPDAVLPLLPPASLAQLAQILPSLQDRLPDLHLPGADGGSANLSVPTLIATASENRQRLIDGLVASLSALARLRPLVLFLDDLHWADTDTLAVLGRLAQRLSDLPMLLLLAYRSDELAENEALLTLSHTLRRNQPQRLITLPRLTHSQVLEMVEHSFNHEMYQPAKSTVNRRQPSSHAQLAVALYHVTQGNALFVTEALRDLQERQSSQASGGLSEAWRLHTIERNHRVQEIIEERITRLPEAAYSVLQVSAVIGRDFSLELLESAFPGDPLDGLEVLLRRNFLFDRSDQRLEFSHQVVCQATYDAMSHLQRRRWHLRVAEALIKLHRDERNPGEVAFHFSRSGDAGRPQFAYYSVKAGEHLARTFGFRQAIHCFDQALAILEATPDSPPHLIQRSLQGRGLAYESLFEPEGMHEAYRRLQQWAAQQGDRTLMRTTYSRLTTMLALFGQQRQSNELLQEFLSALDQAALEQDSKQEIAGASQVILDLLKRRRLLYTPDAPEPDAEWSEYTPPPPPIDDPVGDLLRVFEPVHTVPVLCDYGWTLLVQGQLGAATQCLESVVDLANQTNQPSIASTAYHQLAVLARILGDPAQSHSFNSRSLAINRQMGGATAELASMWPRIGSALIAIDAGQLDEAERRIRRVLDFLEDKPIYRTYHNSANIGLGLIALKRGDYPAAQRLLSAALADQFHFYPHMQVRALLGMAELETSKGNPSAATTYLQRALAFAGRRSLLEEYIASVSAIVRLRPADAPIAQLVERLNRYVTAIGLESSLVGVS